MVSIVIYGTTGAMQGQQGTFQAESLYELEAFMRT